MIQAVIIDLDDTLCLTEQVSFDMENETLKLLGRPPMTRQIHQQTWGKPLFEIIATRSQGVDVAAFQQVFSQVLTAYVADGRLDSISDENFAALDVLLDNGKQLHVLTSRTHGELAHLLEPDHDLAKRITAFYYRDNMQFHKPDPRAFDLLLHDHGILPNQCVYIGDSISDAAAAKTAGLHFVASLESGLRTQEDFRSYPVDYFINRFSECVGVVDMLDHQLRQDNS